MGMSKSSILVLNENTICSVLSPLHIVFCCSDVVRGTVFCYLQNGENPTSVSALIGFAGPLSGCEFNFGERDSQLQNKLLVIYYHQVMLTRV